MFSASAVVAPVSAQSHAAGHLRVVDAPKFSTLPHAVLFDRTISRDAVMLYAVLQSHWWQGGECWASHATLADEMRVSERMLRRYLNELIAAGHITEEAAGYRRSKTYRPSSIGTTCQIETVNQTPVSVQSELHVRTNRNVVSDSYKKTPEKKTQEEKPPIGGIAADAAPEPEKATVKPKKSKPTTTPCPETFPLEAKHVEYAAGLGLSEAQAKAETNKFLAHHRFKGTRGVDWYAGWQNWMRRAVEYGASTRTNGTPAQKPRTDGAKGFKNVLRY
jgi:hypothetical protein